MKGPYRKSGLVVKVLNGSVYDLPVPMNLSFLWSFGSQLGVCLVIQVVSGVMLSFHYAGNVDMAFDSVIHIIRNVKKGWMLRSVHANGASVFFIYMYLHIGRGLYYGLYKHSSVWNVGFVLFFLVMGTAFLGYVLPWGQMSYWGATVITSLITAVPYVGGDLVNWIWGGFSVGNPTLSRFYSLHFLFPFFILALSVIHIYFLHEAGSSNPLGVSGDGMLVRFHPFLSVMDNVAFVGLLSVLMLLVCYFPGLLENESNWTPADPMKTPLHIEPEWYFLFAYSVLRCIPSKVGGVLGLGASIFILLLVPLFHSGKFKGFCFYPISQFFFWGMVASLVMLTWLGACMPEWPYDMLARASSAFYFSTTILSCLSQQVWDVVIE